MTHIEGHVPASHSLSPRQVFQALPPVVKPLIVYDIETLWENDTRKLPRPLRKARRRLKEFTQREIIPRALATDLESHLPAGAITETSWELLGIAGRKGLLTDLLPRPLGSGNPGTFLYPLAWYQSIRTEELSRGCGGLMLLLSAHALGVAPIIFSGDLNAIRRFVLPAFRQTLKGDPHLFAFAITEPAAGSDVEDGHGASYHQPGTVANRVDGGWSLNGRKVFISGGDIAKSITVFAALEDEGIESWTCFLVTRDMLGFNVTRTELKMGMRASGAAELVFDDVFVPDDHVIGGLRNGWALNRAILNTSRLPVAGMGVGLAQAATDAAIEFACQMKLGTKALIHYQEIQMAVAEMIAQTSAARSLVWRTAGKNFAPRQDEASMCKFYATDTALRVCDMALDLLSNHSMLHVNRVEKIYRDARLTQIFEGTNEINHLSMIEDQQEFLLSHIDSNE